MLSDLDRYGTTTPDLFENVNIRRAHSVTPRKALGWHEKAAREIVTMLYGEVHPSDQFRFVSFRHPLPLLYSSRSGRFAEIDRDRMVQFLPLELEVPEDHPDRRRYASMRFRKSLAGCSNTARLSSVFDHDSKHATAHNDCVQTVLAIRSGGGRSPWQNRDKTLLIDPAWVGFKR